MYFKKEIISIKQRNAKKYEPANGKGRWAGLASGCAYLKKKINLSLEDSHQNVCFSFSKFYLCLIIYENKLQTPENSG